MRLGQCYHGACGYIYCSNATLPSGVERKEQRLTALYLYSAAWAFGGSYGGRHSTFSQNCFEAATSNSTFDQCSEPFKRCRGQASYQRHRKSQETPAILAPTVQTLSTSRTNNNAPAMQMMCFLLSSESRLWSVPCCLP
jgi:hypothetical protein